MNLGITSRYVASIFACLVFLHSAAARAQESSGTISGIITEAASGEAVIGATVAVYTDSASVGGRATRGAITNRFGFYSVAGLRAGQYWVQVRSIGLAPAVRTITLSPAAPSARFDAQLNEGEIRTREIQVQAQRESSPTATISTVTLRPSFIEQLPSLGGEVDVFRALQLLPGVKAVSEISSGLYVRGGSPDQNLILLDGVIVYNPSHLGGFLSTFNSDALRDVKLIKGAFPAEYGGRLSSVVDMTMREGTREKISGTAGVSLINSRLTIEGPIAENSTFMVSGRRMYLDVLTSLLPDSDEMPRYYFYDVNAKANWRISGTDHIYASGYFGRDVLTTPPEEDDIFGINWGNITGNFRWMHIISPQVFTNFSAIITDYDFSTQMEEHHRDSGPTSVFKSVSGIRDYMLRGEAQIFPHPDHNIKVGVEATQHRFRADASAELEDFAKIERDPTIRTSIDASVYAQDEWSVTPLLSANIGGRAYYFENGNYFRFEPRISASFILSEALSVRAAFSTGNQFLHLVARNDISLPTDVWFPSTETVKPAESMQGVVGLESTFLDGEWLVTLEGYYKTMENLLEYRDTATFSLDVPLEKSFTVGSGRAYGVELFVNRRVGDLTGWLGYTLAWTHRTFPELNRGREFYPRYDRRHDVALVLTYRLGESWEFGASWVYGTGQAYTVPTGLYTFTHYEAGRPIYLWDGHPERRFDYTERNGYRLPAFHKLDANFTHSFSWFALPWKFSINLYNVYGRRNVFAQYVSEEADGVYKFTRFTLFPFIPTFGLSCKF